MKMFMDFVEIEVPDETILWENGRMVDGEGRPISTERDDHERTEPTTGHAGGDKD